MGDLIAINLALFNKSNESIYFLNLETSSIISVKDSKGVEEKVWRHVSLLEPEFNLIDSSEYDSKKFVFLIGCKEAEKRFDYSYISEEDDFNNNHFVKDGDGCIDIKKPGKYLIKGEVFNPFQTNQDRTKTTALDRIESNSFEISVIK